MTKPKDLQPLQSSLANFLAHLTTKSGVYRMLDKDGHVLYVGKATNLKHRVNSYFNKQNTGVKTRALVSQIAAIEVSVTRSETEALLLESNLIKAFRPKYNVLMRDDKSYPFIHIAYSNDYPRIEMVRCKKRPTKGLYFGPFPSVTAVRDTLGIIQKVFKIRNCSDTYFNARSRPCLQYQIKRCSAPCTMMIAGPDYAQAVNDAIRFLQGKSQLIIETLAKRMDEAVARLAYEEAAQLRDQMKSLRLVQEQQGVVRLQGDADVIVLEAKPGFACVMCVTIREGQVLASRSFFPTVPKYTLENETDEKHELLWQQVFTTFIAYFYLEMPERIPALIITDRSINNTAALTGILSNARGKKCQIQIKPRGTKARWLDFAQNNLRLAIAERTTSTALMTSKYQALAELLGCTQAIHRMECFDISHTQGDETVASCVVFDANGPCKRAYRQFNIRGVTPGDDYAAMEMVITRRFKRLIMEHNLPQLIVIDGGKGQVSAARRALALLNIHQVMVMGMAKGPERKAGRERIILADPQQEITLPIDSLALHLLQQIRDEAHRFAIAAHRKKRQKKSIASSLENIPGVGPKRRQALLRRFGGLRELSKAPVDEIAKVHGISEDLAVKIYEHLNL